ncbi:plasmolipin-like [Lytechinus variegatus]|uniref:plasmolipin-like n=1 Tax=Lytechinus variegatus TaxID=7654 RepID=UPI001BB19D0C|nr:plasmolipin-like [Lytechinus variegatus]
MADPGAFPDSHTTSTYTTTTTQQAAPASYQFTVDTGYVKSVPGILKIVEIIVGFLYWTVVASYSFYFGGYSWIIFVAVTAWVFTLILFLLFLFQLAQRVTIINWVLTELINNAADCLLHFIAAIIISVRAGQLSILPEHGKLVWGCLCGWTLVVLYGLSTFFNFRDFQAMGGTSSLRFPGQQTTMATTTTTTTTVVQQQSTGPADEKVQDPPPYPGGPF